jgi:hypothetical protein
MSVGYHHARVKLIMLFDIAIFEDDKRYLLQGLEAPVARFVGDPRNIGSSNVRSATFHGNVAS